MASQLILAPVLIPFFAAICCLFSWFNTKLQKWIFLLAALLLVWCSTNILQLVREQAAVAVQMGSWPAPFGITFVADLFSAIMVLLIAIIGLIVFLFSLDTIGTMRVRYGFYPLLLFLLMGLNGAVLAGDVFNLFVWFEILLMSCFVLLTLGGTKAQLEGSIKYVTINFLASCLLLAGIGMLYGITGTLNMADLSRQLPQMNQNGLISTVSVFFMISFGIKSAIFPLFFWLPASYHTPPIAISALIAGLLTKVGMYVFIRFFTLIFSHDTAYTHQVLLVASGCTMLIGVLGAAAQNDFRKILSFHIVSQIGYMLMGLALYSPLALAGSVYFIVHNILVKTNLFLISGAVYEAKGSFRLKILGGVYGKYPLLSFLFAISAFSLAGAPPLSGFWGKYMLARAGFETGNFIIVLVSLLVSILTLFSMTKIWAAVFWKPAPPEANGADRFLNEFQFFRKKAALSTSIVSLTVLILFIGLFAGPVVQLSAEAAEQLFHTEIYRKTVLGN